MNQISLNNKFINVVQTAREPSFGGNQGWFVEKSFGNMASQGCGVISAVDTLLYINGINNPTLEKYSNEVERFCRERKFAKLFMNEIKIRKYDNRVISLGIIPIQMSGFLNHMMKAIGKPFRFRWNGKHGHKDMYQKMKYMLSNDIPVTWSLYAFGRQIRMYHMSMDCQDFVYADISVNSHYVTVTGIIEGFSTAHPRMIEVSSWGKRYYIDYDEYLEYVGKSLINAYCSNIMFIKKERF